LARWLLDLEMKKIADNWPNLALDSRISAIAFTKLFLYLIIKKGAVAPFFIRIDKGIHALLSALKIVISRIL